MMNELTPKDRRQQRTKDAIMQAAKELIRKGGYEALSMRKIAKMIDYSPAGLYEYFASKEELILAVCEQANTRLANYLRSVDPSLPHIERIIQLGLKYVQFAVENPDEFLVSFTFGPTSKGNFATIKEYPEAGTAFTVLVEAVSDAMQAGVLKTDSHEPFTISYSCWAVVHGMAMLQITALKEFEAPYEDINRWTLERFMRGLTTE